MENRPKTTVILAMTADGKIADFQRNAARFSSDIDQNHLEKQISLVDGVLFGAGTLRAFGTTKMVKDSELLANRKQKNKPSQPINVVISASGKIANNLRFFSQSVPHWLITTSAGIHNNTSKFEKVLTCAEIEAGKINLVEAFKTLKELGLNHIAILGGGELVANFLEQNLIDELWLTVCPYILGGKTAPTPVEGIGFLSSHGQKLELLSLEQIEHEIFLHYKVLSV
ncbi:RibD family protein [Crocosphaera chwakensis]|uniref:Bifunctional deaminase-reductase-like protein n=1 Tax=Crocosphaera chwakensis CCY0110 TaxID=391612 RepID=A3IQL8_9CHRO|nr:dihydrofolate reductase family protein [Crocosphaera chwakensis]EAZ91293.1 bifunctional deaminase-reductase-like protein [Crocosphaera chwakensis CCY0110]